MDAQGLFDGPDLVNVVVKGAGLSAEHGEFRG
jgi:hypothetical protein